MTRNGEVSSGAGAEQEVAMTPEPKSTVIQGLIDEYIKVTKLNSIVRVGFPLLVLSLISIFIITTVMTIWSAFPEKKVNVESVKAGQELMPILNKTLKAFVDDVAPEMMTEIQIKLDESGQKAVKALALEIERLDKNSSKMIQEQVAASMELAKAKQEKMLLQIMPQLKDDPDKLKATLNRLNKAFEMWTVAYTLRIMEDYYLAMARINQTIIENYKPKPGVAGAPGKPQVVEAEMLELFMELLNAAYEGEAEQQAPAAKTEPVAKDAVPAPVEETVAPAEEAAAAPAAEVAGTEAAPAEAGAGGSNQAGSMPADNQ